MPILFVLNLPANQLDRLYRSIGQCRSEGWADWVAAQGADEGPGAQKRPQGARKRAGRPDKPFRLKMSKNSNF
jgi:hypothetical protein